MVAMCFMCASCFLEGDHGETLFSFRRYRRQWTRKTGHAFWYIFMLTLGRTGCPSTHALSEITNLLKAWGSGDEAALARLTEHVYPELRSWPAGT